MAKYGINLARIHAPYFDGDGEVDPGKIQDAIRVVEALKSEGIYVDFSVYWFAMISPKPNTPWLLGYNGKQSPVRGADLQQGLSEKVRGVVHGPPHHANQDNRQAPD